MILGNGDIGKALKFAMRPADESYIFFASGVSNSKEDREEEYDRELKLLLDQDNKKHLVYFSSLSVFYADTRYSHHKRAMERAVKTYFKKYTIVRIGNITWGDNPHTLINHLKCQKALYKELHIEDVFRYIIEMNEFLHWIDLIPEWSCEMNIPGRRLKVAEIVNEYVNKRN